MYLPEKPDDRYGPNVSMILHGVEGNWFSASRAWEKLLRLPIVTAVNVEK
jgi:hypothetical protein